MTRTEDRRAADGQLAATRVGRLVEFDWLDRASACRAALTGNLDIGYILFPNIEPSPWTRNARRNLWPDIEQAFRRFRVVLEVTERSRCVELFRHRCPLRPRDGPAPRRQVPDP